MKNEQHPELEKSEVIERLPLACADETAAVEFFEGQRWNGKPACPHCKSENVYAMLGRDGKRNARYLWRCRNCAEQYTVLIGSIYEESRIPLKHWAYAFWRSCSSKKGVSAREIQRHCQITYKSALFLLHRIRFAIGSDLGDEKLENMVECDETYVGGKPRGNYGKNKRGRGTKKTPVIAMLERGGNVRTKVVANVNAKNLKNFVNGNIAKTATVNTDEWNAYFPLFREWARHDVVKHNAREYARHNADGTVSHVNTCESFFSLLKRGINGTFHAVSKEHLHRYVGEFGFRWNTRKNSDGERVTEALKRAEGKRLTYEDCVCRD